MRFQNLVSENTKENNREENSPKCNWDNLEEAVLES